MTKADRKALERKVAAEVKKRGLAQVATEIPVVNATLRRFLGGQPMHEGTLQQIARAMS